MLYTATQSSLWNWNNVRGSSQRTSHCSILFHVTSVSYMQTNLRCGIETFGTTFVAPPNALPIVPFCFTLLVSLICKSQCYRHELKHRVEQRTWTAQRTSQNVVPFTLSQQISLSLKLGMCKCSGVCIESSACQPSCMHAIWLICTGTKSNPFCVLQH